MANVFGQIIAKIVSAFQADTPIDRTEVTDSSSAQEGGEANLHLLAILTAAAVAVTGRRVVVHRITFLNSNTVSGWAEVGRASIHQSHNLRRNN